MDLSSCSMRAGEISGYEVVTFGSLCFIRDHEGRIHINVLCGMAVEGAQKRKGWKMTNRDERISQLAKARGMRRRAREKVSGEMNGCFPKGNRQTSVEG